jgi:NADPH:quinone reductase-like Zn-dependent oxidoreductase
MTIPTVMSGMVLTGHGGPERLEWRDDLSVPKPGEGEVLVQVGASSVNNTDINLRVGWYSKSVRGDTASGTADGFGADVDADGGWSGEALRFPHIQGADCCGRIAAAGPGADAGRVGQRVLLRALQSPPSPDAEVAVTTLGTDYDGAFAEYTKVRSADAIRIDSPLSDTELASFPCAFSTAEGMIQRVGLGAERVLITGASGGVGSAAVQLARRRGANVTALTSATKADDLRALGADATLDRDADLPAAAFDVVIDLVGGPRWPHLLDSLRNGGRYVTAGAIAGPIVELDLRTLYLRDLTLFGCTHQPDNVFTDLVRYIEAGEIRPVVAETYPLRDLHAAQDAFLAKSHIGKIAIQVRD